MKSSKREEPQALSDYDRAQEVLRVAEDMPPAKKVKLAPYCDVIKTLRRKEYSYGDIADFLTNQLGRKVSRSQVFGFVKRNPLVFDPKASEAFNRESLRVSEKGLMLGKRIREVDSPKGILPDVFAVEGITAELGELKGLPMGVYVGKGKKLYRIEEQRDGPPKVVFVKKLKKTWGKK